MKAPSPFVNIHTHHPSISFHEIINCDIVENVPNDDKKLYSIGIHPWNASYLSWKKWQSVVENYASHPSVLAIGETGIDILRGTSRTEQQDIFLEHIRIADSCNKPLIIHCVRAFNEIIECKKKSKSKVPWIIHGFSSRQTIADELLEHGCFLSFGAAILYNRQHLEKICKTVPENMFFIENDDSALPISLIYEKIADIRSVSVDYLQLKLYEQWHRIFLHKNM